MHESIKIASDHMNATAAQIEQNIRKNLPPSETEGIGSRGMREQHFLSLSTLAAKAGEPEEIVTLYESGCTVSDEVREHIGRAMAQLIRERARHFLILGTDGSRPN